MNQPLKIPKLFLKVRFVWVLFIAIVFYSTTVCSQEKPAKSATIKVDTLAITLDTLSFDAKTKGLFNRLAKVFKFKENKEKKEQQIIYDFILQLIENEKLGIDSNIEEIVKVLDSVDKLDRSKMDSINVNVIENKKNIDSISTAIKASFEVSLQKKLDSIFKKTNVEEEAVTPSLVEINTDVLNQITFEDCSCTWRDAQNDSIQKAIKKCLKPKVKIIGWHNHWNEESYKNYDYRYLSALTLYDYYELKSDGNPVKPDKIDDLANTGVVRYANRNKTDIHITVHSKAPSVIATFLRNPSSQARLVSQLKTLQANEKINLQGVNVYFDYISMEDGPLFNDFIQTLHQAFKESSQSASFDIAITIPSLFDAVSVERVNAYDFVTLNSNVDYYLISTDKMTVMDNKWAQPASPLHTVFQPEFGTIASTINFFKNKIPSRKLIVSVSYLGLQWPVDESFNGKVKPYPGDRVASDIQYNEILQSYKNNRVLQKSIVEGYDTIQRAAFLNIIDSSYSYKPRYYKIWYENQQSLTEKYQWILDNKLAGVSIRGLGYDDGHIELWDAIGSSLITIESSSNTIQEPIVEVTFETYKRLDSIIENDDNWQQTIRNTLENKKIDRKQIQRTFDTSVSAYGGIFGFYKWFTMDTLTKKSIWYTFQWYDYSQDALKDRNKSLEKYALWSDYKWALQAKTYYVTEVGKLVLGEKERKKYLADQETSFNLYRRLIVFSKFSFYASVICMLFVGLLLARINYLDRFNKGGKIERGVIHIFSFITGVLATVLFFYGLYMTPYFDEFGASNEGEFSLMWIFIIIFFGFLVGLFVHFRYFKGKFLYKNLP